MTIERLLEASRAFDRGDLDTAERVYLGVAELDPRSTIALMGLARVALARGTETDLIQAERLTWTVLAHDPENAAARRLLDEWRARSAAADRPGMPPQGAVGDDEGAPEALTPDSRRASAPPDGTAPKLASAAASASPEASASASPEASASDSAEASASASPDAPGEEAPEGDEFPWPDLDEQLARYRPHEPGRLARLFRRGKG